MNYQEIIATKILIDKYNIEFDTPLAKDVNRCDLEYKELRNNEKRDNAEFFVEQIIISDIVSIGDWETYNKNINKFIEKGIQDITTIKKGNLGVYSNSTNYKNSYATGGSVGSCFVGNNSKYSKYLINIEISYFKVNDYSYFVSTSLYLNDYTKSVFNKIANNNSEYYYEDINNFVTIDNEDLFYCYADIIKYEIIKNLKNDGLIFFTDVDNPVYSLYLCNADLKKGHDFGVLCINGDLDTIKLNDIVFNNIVKKSLFYLNLNKTKKDYPREEHFLSLLLGYYNLHNILLSINYEQLKIIDDDLSGNRINYEKIKSINNKYFILSRIINNYETSIFSTYSGLQFYDGEKWIKSESYVEMAYDSIKKVKNEFDNLYKDISKIYDTNRIRDDSCNSKKMLTVSVITLIVSFIAMVLSIIQLVFPKCNYNSNKINEKNYKQKNLSNNNVYDISSVSKKSKVIVEDVTQISSASETSVVGDIAIISSISEVRLNVIK